MKFIDAPAQRFIVGLIFGAALLYKCYTYRAADIDIREYTKNDRLNK